MKMQSNHILPLVAAVFILTSGSSLAIDAEERKYTINEISTKPSEYFFSQLGKTHEQLEEKGIHYYAAMWALAAKCEASPIDHGNILSEAISTFAATGSQQKKIQCLGIMAEAEDVRHSPETYKLMIECLHSHDDKDIRSFAAYSLLWYIEQPTVLKELNDAKTKEQSTRVVESIQATLSRIEKRQQ